MTPTPRPPRAVQQLFPSPGCRRPGRRTVVGRGRETPGNTSRRRLLLRRVEQYTRNLGPREFRRQVSALFQQLAHSRAAQSPVQLFGVRTRPRGSHAAAGRAVECVLETEDLDSKLARRVLIDDPVRGIRVVVVADSGAVAP